MNQGYSTEWSPQQPQYSSWAQKNNFSSAAPSFTPNQSRHNQKSYSKYGYKAKDKNGFFKIKPFVIRDENISSDFQSEEVPFSQVNIKIEAPPVEKAKSSASASSHSSSMVPRKKYEMCKNFREKGTCKYGDKCLFAHGEHELTRYSASPQKDEGKKENAIKLSDPKPDDPSGEMTTKDSTKMIENLNIQEISIMGIEIDKSCSEDLKNQKKMSSNSGLNSEQPSSETNQLDDETQDQGENSTTLSSMKHNTPELLCNKITGPLEPPIPRANFYLNREEEFKELLANGTGLSKDF